MLDSNNNETLEDQIEEIFQESFPPGKAEEDLLKTQEEFEKIYKENFPFDVDEELSLMIESTWKVNKEIEKFTTFPFLLTVFTL